MDAWKYINVIQERVIREKKISAHNFPIKPMNFRRLEMSFSDLITTTDTLVEGILNLYDVPSHNRTLSISPITSRMLRKPRTVTTVPSWTPLGPFNRGTVFAAELFLRIDKAIKGEQKKRVQRVIGTSTFSPRFPPAFGNAIRTDRRRVGLWRLIDYFRKSTTIRKWLFDLSPITR